MGDGELKKEKIRNYGHIKGVETVKKIVSHSIKLKVPIVTFYVFSSKIGKGQIVKLIFYLN